MGLRDKIFLSVAESAAYLGKSTKTIRRYVKMGLLPSEKVSGKFGPEIRIPRKGLDSLAKQMSTASRAEDDPYQILRLYRSASVETKELVKKILTSAPEEPEKDSRGGFLRPFFRKKGGERP